MANKGKHRINWVFFGFVMTAAIILGASLPTLFQVYHSNIKDGYLSGPSLIVSMFVLFVVGSLVSTPSRKRKR